MKRFIFSILCVAVFFIGLGALVEKTGAKFKSDEKALALIAKARQAIGGDSAIGNVKSLNIVGRSIRSFKIDGVVKSEGSETEIAFQLPDQMMRTVKGHGDGDAKSVQSFERTMSVTAAGDDKDRLKVIVNGTGWGVDHGEGAGAGLSEVRVEANGDGNKAIHVIIKKDDGTVQELTGADAEKWIAEHHPEGTGGARQIVLRKTDGTTTVIPGGDGVKVGDPMEGGIVVKKINADHAQFKSEGTTNIRVEANGDGTKAFHVIVKNPDGTVQNLSGADAEKWIAEHHGDEQHMILKKYNGDGDGPKSGTATFRTEDDKTIVGNGNVMYNRTGEGARQNDLLRMTLSLLLTAPAGIEVNYTSAGDGDVDGTSCDVVVAEFGGAAYRLYLSKASSLPIMMSYKGMQPQVFTFRTKAPAGDEVRENMVFTSKVEGPEIKNAEFNVKFSDYRTVNGIQLPFKWTQTVGSEADETFDITNYEINPANIAEKFKNQNVMVRMKKPDGK